MRSLPNHPNHLVLGLTLDSQTQPLLETFHEVLVGDIWGDHCPRAPEHRGLGRVPYKMQVSVR